MAYNVTWEKQGVYCKYSGHVSVADFVHLNEEIAKSHDFERLRYQLTDLRDYDSHNVLKSQAEGIAALQYAHGFTNDRIFRAVVAVDEDVIELVKHWVKHHPTPEKVGLFETVAEARQWIEERLQSHY